MGEWNMKKALVIVALLGMVAVANAEYRVWFTGTAGVGLTNAALISHPSQAITSNDTVPVYTDNLDAYAYTVAAFPNYATTGAGQNCVTPYQTAGPDDWMYIWGQFYGAAASVKIITANMEIRNCTDNGLFPGNVVWYKQDQMAQSKKRWDGASTEADNYSTFRNAAQNLVAVTANGIKNVGATDASEDWNLWSKGAQNGTTGRISLLGAVQGNALSAGKSYKIVVPLDNNGDPNFVISNVPTMPIVGAFKCVPEPASMLLIGLAGLLIRRR